jgi:LysR family glycine cleavage system transcriptional activator
MQHQPLLAHSIRQIYSRVMDQLPPLKALRVFEVAARTGSYAAAADELGLTHGAVSRHVATLEGWLGQTLFRREGRRMVATPTAAMFAGEVAHALAIITRAAEASGRPTTRRILRVSAPTSFAMRWLIPRLDRFHGDHPLIEVAVTTVSTALEELRGGFDVAIRRGARSGGWPQHHAVPVLDDVDTLIASPALLKRKPIKEAADIEGHVLLGSETRAGDWSDWLNAAGLPHLLSHPRQNFDHFFVTRQAIEDGLGIGVGPLPMLSIDIATERLAAPLPAITVQRTGYVALVPAHREREPMLDAFTDWLVQEGRPTSSVPSPEKRGAAR